ncbi:MAG: ABC transporter substrate-binding protein [Alphaproteobacteria bacterium]|nr:ABC transporter substrate-binding protein [Alphaproteobacteria bacterium]
MKLRALLTGLVALWAGVAEAEEISVTHWGVLMYGAPYAVAMDRGFFKEAGIDVTGILSSQGGGTTVRNVMAGGLPYGEVALSAAVAAAKEGLPVKIVSGGARSVAEILWVTLPNSPLQSLKDIQGKKIGYTSPKSVTEMLVNLSLDKVGIAIEKVERVSIGSIGAGLTALQSGKIDAAPIMDPIWARDAAKYRMLFSVKDLLPPMMQTVGVTTPDFAAKQGDKLKAIIAGRRKGVEFIHADPKAAGAIFAKAYKLDPALGETAIRNMIAIDYWSRGALEIEGMNAMVRGLQLVGGMEPGPIDWTPLIDKSFLPADLRN